MEIPGFVDLQINGFSGADFNDPETSVDDILHVTEILAQEGTAGFLATVITNTREAIEQNIVTVTKAIRKQGKNGNILGIHLEGPFLSAEYGYRGAHMPSAICQPDLEWFQRLQKLAEGNLRLVTIAPEYEESLAFIEAVSPEVVVCAGHTCADFATLRRAVAAGLRLFTHFGNGCRQEIDRHNNILVNALACEELTLTFLPDGFHLPEGFIRMLFNCRPLEDLVVVSDVVSTGGMASGRHASLGGEVVLTKQGKLHLAADPNVLAGSSYHMTQCMNHLASLGFLAETDLLQVGYFNPLRVLGIDPHEFGRRSDRVVYDPGAKRFEIRA